MITPNIVKIKCPFCGATLKTHIQGEAPLDKHVTCPVCKERTLFKNFKIQTPPPIKDVETETKTSFNINFFNKEPIQNIGTIQIMPNGKSFQLKLGKNIVGRMASSSIADIQIPTGENRYMSKEHLLIDVKKNPQSNYTHYISLYKQRVNETFINNDLIEYGDCLILQDGDIIRLPDSTLRFRIITDNESTTFNQKPPQL